MARARAGSPVTLEIPGFHGGAQLLVDPDKLEPHQMRKIENMILDEVGMAAMRMGTEALGTIGSSGDRVLSSWRFQRSSGAATQFIVHTTAGELKYSTDMVNWTNIATGLSTTAPFTYTTFTDKVWMANGTNDFRSWDGTTQATFASVPKFKVITQWKDTLFGANDSSNPDRVYSSDPGDGTTWPASNFFDVAKGQGPGITGLSSDANALVVFKLFSHHAVYDPVEFTNRPVDTEKGCLSHFSIIKHRGLIFFISDSGVCLYLGDSPAQIISGPITPLFKDYSYDEAHESMWSGYAMQDRVGWCWPRTGTTDIWQVEHYPSYPDKPWVFHTIPVRNIITVRDAADNDNMLGFGEGNNKTFQIMSPGIELDDSAAFTATIETGWFDFEAPILSKWVDYISVMSRGGYTLDILTDFDDTTVVKTYAVTDAALLDEREIFTDIYCRQIAFRFSQVSSNNVNTTRRVLIGATADSITENRFAIGRLLAVAKILGQYR